MKLVGEKCNVKCKLNDVELSVLWDTGAQISLLSTTQLKKYFGDMEIQNINLLLDDATNFDLTTLNGTKLPYCGWVKVNFQLLHSQESSIQVPMLLTNYPLDSPIIGYNVIEELLRHTRSDTNAASSISSFPETSQPNLQNLVNLIKPETTSFDLSSMKPGKKFVNIPGGQTIKVPCRINTRSLSKKTPVLFEPDEGNGLPSGLQVDEALLTLPGGNCTKIDLQVTNLTSHNIVLPSRTFLGRIQMIGSISPVKLRFKEFPENNNEQNQNEKTETDSKESESVDINNTSFNHDNIPEVKLGDHLTKDQKDYVKQMLFEDRSSGIVLLVANKM